MAKRHTESEHSQSKKLRVADGCPMENIELKLRAENTVLVVIDLQEGFRPAVIDFDCVALNTSKLVQAANVLQLPVLVTEQYPKGLGSTVEEVSEHLPAITPIEKTCFSAAGIDQFMGALNETGRKQVLLSGIESHVCVWQTADDLLASGFNVHVARDAITSRTDVNMQTGIQKMERAGAVITTIETALFELLGRAGTDDFKAIQKLIK